MPSSALRDRGRKEPRSGGYVTERAGRARKGRRDPLVGPGRAITAGRPSIPARTESAPARLQVTDVRGTAPFLPRAGGGGLAIAALAPGPRHDCLLARPLVERCPSRCAALPPWLAILGLSFASMFFGLNACLAPVSIDLRIHDFFLPRCPPTPQGSAEKGLQNGCCISKSLNRSRT